MTVSVVKLAILELDRDAAPGLPIVSHEEILDRPALSRRLAALTEGRSAGDSPRFAVVGQQALDALIDALGLRADRDRVVILPL